MRGKSLYPHITQPYREGQVLCNVPYVQNLKNKTTRKYSKKKQTHRYRELTSDFQQGEERRVGQDGARALKGTNYYVKNK